VRLAVVDNAIKTNFLKLWDKKIIIIIIVILINYKQKITDLLYNNKNASACVLKKSSFVSVEANKFVLMKTPIILILWKIKIIKFFNKSKMNIKIHL
jgi:hypothetical protein